MAVCPFAVWKPVPNHSGAMSAHYGLVLHVQQGNGGLQGWFSNPNSGASSTWWVSKQGLLEQYVDTDLRAWAQGDGNYTYNSVETEGYVEEPLTPEQERALANLYSWGADIYNWPNVLAETPGQRGFGWHGMGGSAWGGHPDCPGQLRKDRRRPILDDAFGQQPTPEPEPEDDDMALAIVIADDGSDQGRWYVTDWFKKTYLSSKEACDQVVWCTAVAGGKIATDNGGPMRVSAGLLKEIPVAT